MRSFFMEYITGNRQQDINIDSCPEPITLRAHAFCNMRGTLKYACVKEHGECEKS